MTAEALELLVNRTVSKADAGQIGARQVANVAYGAACSGRAEFQGLLFNALARAAERRVSEFNAQSLANTAWAFATVNRLDEKLFTAFARVAERRMNNFIAQNLANTAWALATVNRPDEKLCTALARAAELQVNNFKPQELANTCLLYTSPSPRDKRQSRMPSSA